MSWKKNSQDKYIFNFSFNGKNINIDYFFHQKYKKIVSKILLSIYDEKISYEGILYVKKQNFDTSFTSIINKAIGNIALFIWIYRKSNSDIFNFLERNKYELFLENGIYFNEVLDILKSTETKGNINEDNAIKKIAAYLDTQNIKYEIYKSQLCSYNDVINGIDLVLKINNKEWYVQVKPLKSFSLLKNKYKIISSGKLKRYNNVHYYIFLNEKNCLMFANINFRVYNGIIFINKNHLKFMQ